MVVTLADQIAVDSRSWGRQKTHVIYLCRHCHLVDQVVGVLVPHPTLVELVLLDELVADDKHFTRVVVFLGLAELDSELHCLLGGASWGVSISQIVVQLRVEEADVGGVVVHLHRDETSFIFEFTQSVD